MIGTVNINVAASQPQKPTNPLFSFRGSPSSIRVLDCPRSVGNWAITRVYIDVLYPDNTTKEVDCVRTGNVWVGTFEGSTLAGKVTQGYQIKADGVDENENPITGYVLGCGDVYILDDTNDIKALVGKTALRMLDDIPSDPAKGDVVIVNGALKIYDGEEWYSVEVDLSDYYTKAEIDEMVDEIDSSIGELASSVGALDSSVSELGASVSALDSSVSALGSSISILSASVSSLGEDLGVVNASVSSLTSQVTRLSSSMTSLASTKRDKTDRVWEYTRTTDPEMYGVQKFYVTNDTTGEAFDLVDFNTQTKTWSVYEGAVSVVAYNSTLLAVVDENNPHQFDDDGEMRDGWPFYRTNDTTTQWLVEGGDAEYNVIATRRANDTFAFDTKVDEKRDYDDLTWDYPLEQDIDRFGVGNFNVDFNGSLFSLSQFSKTAESRTWSQLDAGAQDRFEIYTSDGRHYNLHDKVDAKTMPFTRTGNDNVVWSIETSNNAYLVSAIKRQPGRLAVYEPNLSNSDERYLDFGQSGAGLVLGANLSASAQAFVQIDDVTLTGPNYMSSRGAQTRGAMKKRGDEPHLKVNGEAVAFVNEIEAATSQMTSEIATLAASVSAMASTVESVSASVSALGSSVSAMASSVSALGSSVQTLASSIDVKRDYDDLTYGGTYDPTDAEGYYGITSWTIEGLKYDGQTQPTFSTTAKFKNNPTYGTGWNDGGHVIYTSDFSTFNLDGFGNAEPVPFTLSLDKTTYEVSFMGTEQQNLTLTANCANQDRLALNSQLAPITASVSALASSMTAVASSVEANASAIQANASAIGELTQSVSANTSAIQTNASAIELTNSHVSALESAVGDVSASVSALASSMSAKRDYLDLTYSTTVPSETIDNSKLVWEDQDPLYNAKLTFTVDDSVAGEEHLAWNDGETCWIDSAMQNFMVWYADDYGYDPADGKFVLVDGADVCLQFNLQDGVNVQTFNYTSENLSSTGTLTMTFTGEPAHQVNDTLALNGAVEVVSASVSTLTSQVSSITTTLSSYATISYVDAAIGAMLSSQL